MFADQIYSKYRNHPMRNHISSLLALSKIEEFITKNRYNNCLEIGGGIGTITELLLTNHLNVYSFEDNKSCLIELEKLKYIYRNTLTIIENFDKLEHDYFDILIIDYPISRNSINRIFSLSKNLLSLLSLKEIDKSPELIVSYQLLNLA